MCPYNSRIRLLLIALPIIFVDSSSCFAQQPVPLTKDWPFDTIKLKNGFILRGVILDETPACVRFQNVRRSTGRPTVSLTAVWPKTDIAKIDKISDADREALKSRLKELDPTGEGERKRMELLELRVIDWNGKAKSGRRYDSDHFSLVSNAPEEVVRRAAVRLEQIYTAYVHFLPPRYAGGKPTTILLYPALDDYQKMLDSQGWKFQNPAFFDPNSNRIVCGSNLQKLGEDLEKFRLQSTEQRTLLDRTEAQLRQLYAKNPMELASKLLPVAQNRRKVVEADKYNDGVYDNATKRLYAIMYHEAFHAYAANFVYPPTNQVQTDGPVGELPRWLNEGLAQIFETAFVEAGELRVGHADTNRLERIKESIRTGQMMPVKALLASGAKQFVVHHREEQIASDKIYLASWALASYLTFNRRLLGTDQLDAFVRAVNRNENPEDAFAKLSGQTLPEFEKDFHAWLMKLRPDGSLLERLGKDR